VILGVVLAGLLRPLGDWQHVFAIGATGFWTMMWLVRATLLES